MGAVKAEEVSRRLDNSTPFWAKHCTVIVNESFQTVPFVFRPWQLEADALMEAQQKAGLPIRVRIGKARKLGFSSGGIAKGMHRATRRANQKMLITAHQLSTAGELFQMATRMQAAIPEDEQPQLTHKRDSKATKELRWANGSELQCDTAKEYEGGRGFTPSFLLLTEIAFYEDIRKLVSLLNAVPDSVETCIVQESTANGENHFYRDWQRDPMWNGDPAVFRSSDSGYVNLFAPWWKYDQYADGFYDDEARAEFIDSIGVGELGEEEPMLIERFELTPEQLQWRRRTIAAKCNHDVMTFHQEYPAFPEEMFLSSGRKFFSGMLVARVIGRTDTTDPLVPAPREAGCDWLEPVCESCGRSHGPDVGFLKETSTHEVVNREETLHVPDDAIFVPPEATGFGPQHPRWKVWEHPIDPKSEDHLPDDQRAPFRPGQYVIFADVAGGEEMTSQGDTAYHAIQVFNHVTKEQAAMWRSRQDPHVLARELYLAGIYWNQALIAVEITGAWGWPCIRSLHRQYRYPGRLYHRKKKYTPDEKKSDWLGWQTDEQTRALMEGHMMRLLAEGRDGIRCAITAREMNTYVVDEKGRSGPGTDSFSDCLMAAMGAQQIAQEERPRPNRKAGEAATSTATRTMRNPRMGY